LKLSDGIVYFVTIGSVGVLE